MSADRNVSSNEFGPNTQIYQGDAVIHNYSSNASRKAFFVLPFPLNEDIIRRPEIDTQLDELLLSSKEGRYCSVALWGLGGSGKTQIALDYAYRRSYEDPNCDIFWVHADNETSFAQDYHAVARKLGLDPKLNGEELFLKVRNCIESQQKWLLILDNADDVTRFGVGAADHTNSLLRFIPGGPGGTVLWTSRDKQIVALVGPRRGIQVPHMAIEEAKKLLSMARDEDLRENEIEEARLLLQELQWLPLAISQAGSFMRRTSTPIEGYLSRLLEGKSRWDTLKKSQHDKHRRPEVSNSILETWDISIRHIKQESFTTYGVLHTIAYIDNQNIPLSVIHAISAIFDEVEQETSSRNENVLKTVIVRLTEFSFISARKAENDAEPTFDMHKLVQDAIRYTLNTGDVRLEKLFSRTALMVLIHLFPEDVKRETWPLCERYATHAMQVSEWAEMLGASLAGSDLLGKVADYFQDRGFLRKAEFTTKKELELAKISATQIPTTTRSHTTTQYCIMIAMRRLSLIYISQDLFEEAERYALETLALSEKVMGEKHHTTIEVKSLLMLAYFGQGHYKKAEEVQEKVLIFRRETYGEKHPHTIRTMSYLAMIYDVQELYDKAKELKVQVLTLSNEILGERHPATLKAIWSLSCTYRLADQFEEAKGIESKILSLQSESDEENPMVHGLETLAKIYYIRGQLGKAKELRKKILSLKQNAFGEKDLDTIMAMQNLARIHCLRREFKEAEELQLNALAFLHETFGEENEQTILAMRYAARLYYMQGLIEKGEEYQKRAMSSILKIYGNSPPPKLLLQIENVSTETLSMRRLSRQFHLMGRISKMQPLIDRQVQKAFSRVPLLARYLSEHFQPVEELYMRRLLKLIRSIRRLFKQRLLKLRLFQGRTLEQCLLKLRLSMQTLLKRRAQRLALSMQSLLRRRISRLRPWMKVLLKRYIFQPFLGLQRVQVCIKRRLRDIRAMGT